jgi:hypothetical protein
MCLAIILFRYFIFAQLLFAQSSKTIPTDIGLAPSKGLNFWITIYCNHLTTAHVFLAIVFSLFLFSKWSGVNFVLSFRNSICIAKVCPFEWSKFRFFFLNFRSFIYPAFIQVIYFYTLSILRFKDSFYIVLNRIRSMIVESL